MHIYLITMKLNRSFFILVGLFSLFISDASADAIVLASYSSPVDRYGHFALGRPHEYSRVEVTSDTGQTISFTLPAHEVFEDLSPRIVKLAENEPAELLTIVSAHDTGSRLMMFRLRNGALEMSAQSAAIGTPNRWLNPVGVADLDGDGQAEISAVITPHIGGILKVYRRQGQNLIEISSLSGFSNHAYRTAELALSTPIMINGKMRLMVPDSTRQRIRFVALEEDQLVEIGQCSLPSQVTGPVKVLTPSEVSVRLLSGQDVNVPNECFP